MKFSKIEQTQNKSHNPGIELWGDFIDACVFIKLKYKPQGSIFFWL